MLNYYQFYSTRFHIVRTRLQFFLINTYYAVVNLLNNSSNASFSATTLFSYSLLNFLNKMGKSLTFDSKRRCFVNFVFVLSNVQIDGVSFSHCYCPYRF